MGVMVYVQGWYGCGQNFRIFYLYIVLVQSFSNYRYYYYYFIYQFGKVDSVVFYFFCRFSKQYLVLFRNCQRKILFCLVMILVMVG